MDHQKAAKLTSCRNFTELAEAISDILSSSTLSDLLEALRISKQEFIREQAALALYAKTGRSRKAPECSTDFDGWLHYILEHSECITENDDKFAGLSSWRFYMVALRNAGILKGDENASYPDVSAYRIH